MAFIEELIESGGGGSLFTLGLGLGLLAGEITRLTGVFVRESVVVCEVYTGGCCLISVAKALVAEEMLGDVVEIEKAGMVLVGTQIFGVRGASAADISENDKTHY